MQFLKEGDGNTKCFHALVQHRRKNFIHKVVNDQGHGFYSQ